MFEVSKEFLEAVIYILCEDIDEPITVYEGYSGRGMYGKKVDAIAVSKGSIPPVLLSKAIMIAAFQVFYDEWLEKEGNETPLEFIDDFYSEFKGLSRSDSIGLGTVYY